MEEEKGEDKLISTYLGQIKNLWVNLMVFLDPRRDGDSSDCQCRSVDVKEMLDVEVKLG